MATSRFTSTFLAASALEPAERLTVTMAGIISGAIPTAMASEKSSASMRGRDKATLTMKMNAVSTAATANKKRENCDKPTSKAVWPCFSDRPAAICPNAVRAPVRTTTPSAGALVDDRPHEHASRLIQRRAAGDRLDRLGDRHRLSGQHPFVALEFFDGQQAQIGRHQSPDTQRHHVAGHQVRDRNPARASVPQHLGFVADLASQGFHGHLGPVLVEEPQADAEGDDHHDDHGVGATAGQRRHQGRAEQHHQDRVADLTEQHRARHAPDGWRVRSARTRRAARPRRQTTAPQSHSRARRAPPRSVRPAAATTSKSRDPAGAAATMTEPPPSEPFAARAIGPAHSDRRRRACRPYG